MKHKTKYETKPFKKRHYRVRWNRVAITALALAALAAVPVFLWRRPALQAKAVTLCGAAGHLTAAGSETPSASFVRAADGFGLRLLKQLDRQGGQKSNVFLSPVNLYLALGIVYNGASGGTAAAFRQTLGIPDMSLSAFNGGSRALQNLLLQSGRFTAANSVWLSLRCRGSVSSAFLNRNRAFYGARVSALDFTSSAAPGLLNRWVQKNTGNRIDPGFRQSDFDENTLMELIATVCFKSDWKKQFDASLTADGVFHAPSGDRTVSYMHGTFSRYFENQKLQGILLPYDDSKTSLLVLLPKRGLSSLLAGLTAQELRSYVLQNENGAQTAVLSLPRVNLRYKTKLNGALSALGLKAAFDPSRANFSAMVKKGSGLSPFISSVLHMTYLHIDEKGTEAAAATAVGITNGSALADVHTMDVNRPFLTAIVNNKTGAAFFLGAVTDPSSGQT